MSALRVVAAVEAAVLGAGVALLVMGPAAAAGGAWGAVWGGEEEGEVTEAPPRFEIPQEVFVIPDRGVLEVKMDLNTVMAEDLALVPGIGPGTARKIVEDRQKNGPFSSLEDVTRIKGIGPSTVVKLAPHVTVGGAQERVGEVAGTAADRPKININTASLEELTTLPGIGKTRAQRIIDGRPYKSREDLLHVKGLGHAAIQRLEPMIEF